MYIIITVDTENLQTPTRLGKCKENLLDNRKYGYRTIMDICDEFQIKATFFFSPYEAGIWGEEKIKKACLNIYDRGYDIQLHTHPEWVFDEKRINMFEYTYNEQKEIVNYGIEMLSKWTGETPIAHRAGGYSLDKNTIKALKKNNIKFDYSMFYTHKNSKITWSKNNIINDNDIVEIPVSVVEKNNEILKIDIDWLEYSDIKKAIVLAKSMKLKCLTLFMHSYSYFKFSESYSVIEGDYEELNKFIRILEFIKSDDEIKIVTAKEFAKIYENNGEEFIFDDLIPKITSLNINEKNNYEEFYIDKLEKKYFYNDIYKYFRNIDLKKKSKLKQLFVNSFGKNIGIYCAGQHTKCLLNDYKRLIGNLNFNLFIFDSNNQKWNMKFCGYKIYPIDKINDLNLDEVIISSYEFQDEIYKNIKEYTNKKINILKIYEENDKILFK